MFEELFDGPIALARQRTTAFPEERRQFLRHLKNLGYARNSLRAVACELVVITQQLDLSVPTVDVAVVEAAARRWGARETRRGGSPTVARSTRNFRYWATQWLRSWRRRSSTTSSTPLRPTCATSGD